LTAKRKKEIRKEIDITYKQTATMSSFSGRVYSVTGAASGIGQAVAVRLTELGAAGLALSDLNLAGLETTRDLCKLDFGEKPERNLCFFFFPLSGCKPSCFSGPIETS